MPCIDMDALQNGEVSRWFPHWWIPFSCWKNCWKGP